MDTTQNAVQHEPDTLTRAQLESLYHGQCKLTDEIAAKLEAGSDKALLARIADLQADLARMNQKYVEVQKGIVPDGHVIAPHFRGYALLGLGGYLINSSAPGTPAELVLSVATEAEKAGRVVGDVRYNEPEALIQPEVMAVRIGFDNVVGLDALEQQLRFLRKEHFPESVSA